MSTIAYRDGVMAADSRAYAGFNLSLGAKTKIRRMDDGTLIGCSSTEPGLSEAVLDWYANGANPANGPKVEDTNFSLLAVKITGEAFYAYNNFLMSGPIQAPFFAIGSGDKAALGALYAGVSAYRAVEIAAEVDVWTALPVVTLTHKG